AVKYLEGFYGDKRRNGRDTQGHQHRHQLVTVPNRVKGKGKCGRNEDLLRPVKRIILLYCLLYTHRRLAESKVESVGRTNADAVHTLHTAWIRNHSILANFGVNDHVRGANRRT